MLCHDFCTLKGDWHLFNPSCVAFNSNSLCCKLHNQKWKLSVWVWTPAEFWEITVKMQCTSFHDFIASRFLRTMPGLFAGPIDFVCKVNIALRPRNYYRHCRIVSNWHYFTCTGRIGTHSIVPEFAQYGGWHPRFDEFMHQKKYLLTKEFPNYTFHSKKMMFFVGQVACVNELQDLTFYH